MKLNQKVMKLIDDKNFANFAFVTPKGNPHVSPVWIDRDGDTIQINSAEIRAKSKLLKENQKVMISIMNQKNPYERVLIRGHIIEITKKGAEEQNNKMSVKYLGTIEDPGRPVSDRVLFKIEADRILE